MKIFQLNHNQIKIIKDLFHYQVRNLKNKIQKKISKILILMVLKIIRKYKFERSKMEYNLSIKFQI